MLAKGNQRVTHIDKSCWTSPCAIKQTKTWPQLQTTRGKDDPNISFMQKLSRTWLIWYLRLHYYHY